MKTTLISLFITLLSVSTSAQTATDSVTICGKVTDYNGQPPDSVSVMWEVTINGEETPIHMIQEIKEYFEPGEYGNAYLLFVDLEKKNNGMPYNIFASR